MISLKLQKNAALKANFHSFEYFFEKTSSNDGNPVRQSEHIFGDILGDRLVNVSWGVLLKFCFTKKYNKNK